MLDPRELPEALQQDDCRPATGREIAVFCAVVLGMELAVVGAIIGVVNLIGRVL